MVADKKSYTLRMPVALLSRIDAHARKNGMTQAQVVIQACRQYLDPDVPYMAPSTPAGKPDMAALRAICSGEMPATMGVEAISDRDTRERIVANLHRVAAEIPICGKTWWEDGEHYECLMDAGHKEAKHGFRGMVRRIGE